VSDVTQYTALIDAKDAGAIRTLLTNTTQETQVLLSADTTARALSGAWMASRKSVSSDFETRVQTATQKVFRELIDITTMVEIEYLLQRLS
jgi:chorismate mutase